MSKWMKWVYEGTAGQRARAAVGARAQTPADGWAGCAVGDAGVVEAAIAADPAWVNRAGGALGMVPLVAVTHSWLVLEPGFADGLVACARALLAAGADASAVWVNPDWPDFRLSALYGAAGKTHHVGLTRLLLEAGADPNDGESLYHSVEGPDLSCTRALLEAGARVRGSNAIAHVLDYEKLESLRLLLDWRGRQADAGARADAGGGDLLAAHHAILRGRGVEFVKALADAGEDLRAVNQDGISLLRWAAMFGRTEVVQLLREHGVAEELSEEDEFVGACARGEAGQPGMVARLGPTQLKALPRMAELGSMTAVKAMVVAGWPLEAMGDSRLTALNWAVFRGDVAMTRLLLEAGADWRTMHGYDDNVCGTVSFVSRNGYGGDLVGCVGVLIEKGVPVEAFAGREYSEEVQGYLDGLTI